MQKQCTVFMQLAAHTIYQTRKEYTLGIFISNQFKQLALGWQIAKQLPGLNPLSLSNNKNYR